MNLDVTVRFGKIERDLAERQTVALERIAALMTPGDDAEIPEAVQAQLTAAGVKLADSRAALETAIEAQPPTP